MFISKTGSYLKLILMLIGLLPFFLCQQKLLFQESIMSHIRRTNSLRNRSFLGVVSTDFLLLFLGGHCFVDDLRQYHSPQSNREVQDNELNVDNILRPTGGTSCYSVRHRQPTTVNKHVSLHRRLHT